MHDGLPFLCETAYPLALHRSADDHLHSGEWHLHGYALWRRGQGLLRGLSFTIPEAAANWVEALKLQKQPYGNFMTEAYTSDLQARLPPRFKGGTRALSATIYNLFALNRTDTTFSQGGFPLHMLEGDETYHYYAGDGPLTLFIFDFGSGTVSNVSLGAAKPMQDQPQYTIRGQTWSGALLAKGSTWALTGASTTPGFDPRDSHMAAGNATLMLEFHGRFPQYADLISRLTAF